MPLGENRAVYSRSKSQEEIERVYRKKKFREIAYKTYIRVFLLAPLFGMMTLINELQ